MPASPAPPFATQLEGSFHRCIDIASLANAIPGSLSSDPRDRIVGPHDLHVLHASRRQQHWAGFSPSLTLQWSVP